MAIVRIRVLFFGVVRDITGVREDTLDVATGSAVATVFEHYATKFPRLKDMSKSLVLARNQQFADLSAACAHAMRIALEVARKYPRKPGDEFASIPLALEVMDPAGAVVFRAPIR